MKNETTIYSKPFIFATWPLIFLIGFLSPLLPQAHVVGYRWSAELFLGIFLLCTVAFCPPNQRNSNGRLLLQRVLFFEGPIFAFLIWSAASVSWAIGTRNAVHHTLLWACYACFFVLANAMVAKPAVLDVSLRCCGAIIFAISTSCVIEFLFFDGEISYAFTARYYSYAEAFASLLPIFLVRTATATSQRSAVGGGAIVCIAWGMILCTTSRAMFIAGVSGAASLIVIGALGGRKKLFFRPMRVLFVVLLAITLASQISLSSGKSVSVSERIVGGDEASVLSARSRLLLWGMAIEGWREAPIIGIGAGNYFTRYKDLRRSFSDRNTRSDLPGLNEDLIPERAHNEFLQVLGELGTIGAIFFSFILAGVGYLISLAFRKRASLLGIGATCGIVAFLIASAFSSYSFRFPANGVCFFFLLAIAANDIRESQRDRGSQPHSVYVPRLQQVLGTAAAISMIAFATIRGLSVRYLANAHHSSDPAAIDRELQHAIWMDGDEPVFRFYYGQQLYLSGRHDEAVPQFRSAIDRGMANSSTYFNLISAEILLGNGPNVLNTFEEALGLYPRSVFLLTAFSSYLHRNGDEKRANEIFRIAYDIDARNALSWKIAHDEGLEALVLRSVNDNSLLPTMELRPETAALVLSNHQRLENEVRANANER